MRDVSAMVAGAGPARSGLRRKQGTATRANPKAEAPSTAATTPAAGTGNTVTINLGGDDQRANSFKFDPDNVTIKAGDVVVFKGDVRAWRMTWRSTRNSMPKARRRSLC